MRYTRFGKTDLNVSVITAGTWAMGGERYGEMDDEQSIAAIRAMLDQGVNIIDTAPCYGNGHSEKLVAKAIKGYDRDKLVIVTKCGLIFDEEIPGTGCRRNITAPSIAKEIDDSRRRLDMDVIDVYLVHKPDFLGTPVEETFSMMQKLKDIGKIRHIGVSNYPVELMKEAEKYAEIEVIQPPYSMVDRKEKAVLEHAKSLDMGVMSYGSLGAGFLSGRYRTRPDWPEDDFRFTFYDYFNEPKFSKGQKMLAVMDEIAAEHGVPVGQVAINWNIQCGLVDTAILGASKVRHAEENCASTLWCLSEEEMARLEKALEEFEA
ncbi:MAG: aldo/keto reductase [Lachnospiraceae bacterium]|nr:aldo/keto reductase [Lachnospiraceae bacterium]MBQ9593044.1 aldo/keto reductase [Lachnospiraceae bacterium]MBR0153069.1 aldo/keto reductase [Lachnospiraceae bacterium]